MRIINEEIAMEWVSCKECIYLEDCELTEDRDGCYAGDKEEYNNKNCE
jgi:hypothetical protein